MLLSLSTTIGYFNPRPREEGDPDVEEKELKPYKFQSTPS